MVGRKLICVAVVVILFVSCAFAAEMPSFDALAITMRTEAELLTDLHGNTFRVAAIAQAELKDKAVVTLDTYSITITGIGGDWAATVQINDYGYNYYLTLDAAHHEAFYKWALQNGVKFIAQTDKIFELTEMEYVK